MWKIKVTDSAYRDLKRYRRHPQWNLIQGALSELERANDPTELGTFKNLLDIRCYSYRVSSSLRLLYSVDREEYTILIHGVGDHKEVYGKD